MADRAGLETTLPPVFGKEMERRLQTAGIPNTDIGLFLLIIPPCPPLEKGGWGDLRLESGWSS